MRFQSRHSILLPALVQGMLFVTTTTGCIEQTAIDVTRQPPDQQNIVTPITEPCVIEITGDKYRWQIRYPGVDGVLKTADDVILPGDLRVPLGVEIDLVLKSVDYVYSLKLPDFKLHEMAVPDLEFHLRFHPRQTGRYELQGDEFCGDPHPELSGSLIVESRDQYQKWMIEQPAGQRSVPRQ